MSLLNSSVGRIKMSETKCEQRPELTITNALAFMSRIDKNINASLHAADQFSDLTFHSKSIKCNPKTIQSQPTPEKTLMQKLIDYLQALEDESTSLLHRLERAYKDLVGIEVDK